MKKTILLFGFEDLFTALALQKAASPFGAEVVPVGRSDYQKTIGALAGLDEAKAPARGAAAPVPMGRMLVLCGVERDMEALLPALNAAGAVGCLKAVLTPTNRTWTAAALYRELSREHGAMQRR